MKNLVLVFFLAALVGCGKDSEKMVYVDFKVYDPTYIAIEKGFFKDIGLDVQIQGSIVAGPTAIQAVASGHAQAGLSSIPAIINANAAGLPIVGVADIQSAIGKQPLEEYFVRGNITSAKDIKGKKFAVNLWKSSFHYTALMYLEKNGLNQADVEFVLMPFDKQGPALLAGAVDIIGLMEPYASAFKKLSPDSKILFNAFDVFGERQFSLIFINRVWADAHPDKAKKFVLGLKKAVAWSIANPVETKEIISKYTGIDKANIPDYIFQKDAAVIEKDIQAWLDYMKSSGDLKVTWLTAEEIGTNRYGQ